jgi:PPK2 family polyphosphate:nucleotide phosphotransferase
MLDTSPYRIAPDTKVDLDAIPTDADGGVDEKDAKKQTKRLLKRLDDLQEVLYAQAKHPVLVVLQAMDAGGKDSTIRHVFGGINPQGCDVVGFKKPTEPEMARDYLWRVHAHTPPRGHITVFNRSHYEDVLIVRVKGFVQPKQWKKRYRQINDFERMLAEEGTVIRKFFLHISKDYQQERLQRRLDRPDKHWKFNPDDLTERALWDEYRHAFEDAIGRCSTKHAPWYIVPAENRTFRNLLVATVMVETLESLDLEYPKVHFDPKEIEVV